VIICANILSRDGILLRTGLFKINAPTVHESTALISDATNVRELTLEFPNSTPEHSPTIFYVSHGSISYHFNYFIKTFGVLDRIEIITRWTSSDGNEWDSLTRGIALGNSYLKSKAKLSSVIGRYDPEELVDPINMMLDGILDYSFMLEPELWDRWFWQAEEGNYLRTGTAALDLR
jgi:hypothetical protein